MSYSFILSTFYKTKLVAPEKEGSHYRCDVYHYLCSACTGYSSYNKIINRCSQQFKGGMSLWHSLARLLWWRLLVGGGVGYMMLPKSYYLWLQEADKGINIKKLNKISRKIKQKEKENRCWWDAILAKSCSCPGFISVFKCC